jgi:diguanylate cyclase (GGDEF)-like protein/PAS domain S-box-containing protein
MILLENGIGKNQMASASNRAESWDEHVSQTAAVFNDHLVARHLVFSLSVFLFYFLLNRPEIILVLPELGFTAWYPAAGLVLAVMLSISPRYFPLLAFADALAGAAIYHQPLLSWSEIIGPFAVTGAYAGAAYMLRGPLKIDPTLRHRRDVVRYLGVTMAAALLATLGGVTCLVKDHTILPNKFWQSAFQWYVSDVIGLVGFAPFLLIHVFPWAGQQLLKFRIAAVRESSRPPAGEVRKINFIEILEATGQFAAIALVLWIMFGRAFGSKEFYFLSFVPIIWIAMRHGIRRVTSAILFFNFGIVLVLRLYPGPPDLQLKVGLLMLAVSGTGLIVGSEVTERQRVAGQLKERTDFLNSLIEHNPLAIAVQDDEGQVRLCNDAFTELFLYSREEVVGKALDPLIGLQESSSEVEKLPTAEEFGRPSQRVIQAIRKDKKILDIELHQVSFDLGNWRSASYAIYRDISEQVKSAAKTKEHAESLDKLVSELQLQTTQMSLLNNMGDLLQCCGNLQEAFTVIPQSARQILSAATRGVLFVFKPSRDSLEVATSWGQSFPSESRFPPSGCWALRRGQAYWSEYPRHDVICSHIKNPVKGSYLCVPLVAQGETLGVLHVEYHHGDSVTEIDNWESWKATQERLCVAVAGQIGLSLASLRLRETLREQSIRDPLTGLFNRRFMQESLNRELLRSKRKKLPLSIVFLDLDHFKRFNDTFGHDAGDKVLRSVAETLKAHYRADDVVCRYGGEEFAIILPESTSEEAAKRSDGLREKIRQVRIRHEGKMLDGITLSMGVAAYPEHASDEEELLRLADSALYQSKSGGRDRITTVGI